MTMHSTVRQTDQSRPIPVPAETPAVRGKTHGALETTNEGANQMTDDGPKRSLAAQIGRRLAQLILPLLILAGGYGALKYLVATKPQPPVKPVVEKAFSVSTTTAKRQDIQPQIEAFGTTVAGRQVEIRSLVAGQILKTGDALREGGTIDKNELLVQVDPIDYQTALGELRAQQEEARARREELEGSLATSETTIVNLTKQLKLAKTDVERARPLAKRGAVAKRTVDDREQIFLQRQQALDELTNNLKVWDARIKQQIATEDRLEQSIERAKQRLIETELRAPFDAYVSDVTAQVGRIVSSNDRVAVLIDRDWIDVRFTLTNAQYGRIVSQAGSLKDRPIKVNWVLGANTFTYDATVERIGAEIASSTGGVEIFARIKNPADPIPLRPGAFVELSIPDKVFKDAVRLPASALYYGDTVFAVEGERLKSYKVRVVGGIGDDLLVEGNVPENARIVTSRISTPGDGIKVTEAEKS